MKVFYILAILFGLSILGCKKTEFTPTGDVVEPISLLFDITHNPNSLHLDTVSFKAQKSSHSALSPMLDETSGILASLSNPAFIWLHEDSGNNGNVYLYNALGKRVKKYSLQNITSIDYEDISAGYGPTNELNHILIGDIGDNNKSRSNIAIFRFKEPDYANNTAQNEDINLIEELTLTYPQINGITQKENAEAFFIDPISKDLFLFTKASSECQVMHVKAPLPFGSSTELTHIGNLNFRFQKITAADISTDGKHVLLKSYDYIFYWFRGHDQPLAELFQTEPIRLPYEAEAQGEAICWLNQGTQYMTISEFKNGIVPELNLYNQ